MMTSTCSDFLDVIQAKGVSGAAAQAEGIESQRQRQFRHRDIGMAPASFADIGAMTILKIRVHSSTSARLHQIGKTQAGGQASWTSSLV